MPRTSACADWHQSPPLPLHAHDAAAPGSCFSFSLAILASVPARRGHRLSPASIPDRIPSDRACGEFLYSSLTCSHAHAHTHARRKHTSRNLASVLRFRDCSFWRRSASCVGMPVVLSSLSISVRDGYTLAQPASYVRAGMFVCVRESPPPNPIPSVFHACVMLACCLARSQHASAC